MGEKNKAILEKKMAIRDKGRQEFRNALSGGEFYKWARNTRPPELMIDIPDAIYYATRTPEEAKPSIAEGIKAQITEETIARKKRIEDKKKKLMASKNMLASDNG